MRYVCCLISLIPLLGCSVSRTSLWSGGPLGPEAQALAGARAAPGVEARFGGVLRDADAERRMARVAARLRASNSELPARPLLRLLAADAPNACSLPVARVYVTRGLYRQLEHDAQLAAVLAHEFAHIVSEDHFKPRCVCEASALRREQAADARGAQFLAAAGYQTAALGDVIAMIADHQPEGWAAARRRALAVAVARADNFSAALVAR